MSRTDPSPRTDLARVEGVGKPDEQLETSAEERNRRDSDGDRRTGAATLRPTEFLRFLWTQLTSMRTALVLLFALALAAIPGSLIPQRSISPIRVSDYIAAHPTLGPVYDKIGMFEVYSSAWFSAIYLLLFVSLIGCIVPRIRVYLKGLRAQPPRTPRNLARLPVSRTGAVDDDVETVLVNAEAALRKRHYRIRRDGDSVSAERGYLRELGNLVFHVSMVALLIGVAINSLFGYRGESTVVVGQGFSNNLSQYDDFSSGAGFRPTMLKPFTVLVDQFIVKFETGPVQTGAARQFTADVSVTDAPGDPSQQEVLEVNKPLHVGGSEVHLIGHGYAPVVTVTDAQGNVAYSGPVVFLPQDGNFTSAGVVKVPDARPDRLAFQAVFTPTGVNGGQPVSIFPDWLNPLLYLNGYYGKPAKETGVPESVYSLNPDGLTRFETGGDVWKVALRPGQTQTLPDGKGSIRFDSVDRWVKLQVGYAPGLTTILIAIGFAVAGLCLSLFIRPRRIWVRASAATGPDADGDADADPRRTLVQLGGLDRADARVGLDDDVAELTSILTGEPSEPAADVKSEETQ